MKDSNTTAACVMQWDGVSCWPAASEGETVSVSCPLLLLKPQTPPVFITRSCTAAGWSEPSVPYYKACLCEAPEEDEGMRKEKIYFDTLKTIYSVGYGLSLAALLIAVLLFCCFRKLLCPRNYIHLNLFLTFILRSVAVFIKDSVLFADKSTNHCTLSTVGCKAAMSLFHFCVLSNFCWLLVEDSGFVGTPSLTIAIWILLKTQFDDEGCWDDLSSSLWWIIKIPILLSIFINFMIFLNISRIIIQKTKASHMNQSDTHLYRRLVHSTLLLIPLFGVHYTLFAMIPEHVGVKLRLFFELVLGSFQGLIVALLYCFLNGEVQKEIRSTVRRYWPETKTTSVHLQTQEYLH
ncbi:growth hormone releasing hormone receptor 2 isoform X2 [Cheilinus undulatus]|uniref:growth hormone releasing hormone receptor 2 isoform X2 n=1 Tax=Cheilinus undulatus TaxID=241271 RepID=UPI001BD5D6EA|nr:growth hormone releasing hormone receptor 2 isoform X2 [Cheilinus undulatus]